MTPKTDWRNIMKFEKTVVLNLEGAIRGMRNPLDSWSRSDSGWGCYDGDSPICRDRPIECPVPEYVIGPKDMELCQKLIRGGSEHRKFLRQIIVCVDITAPRYWWQEFDTYKIGTVVNSCSTMHKLKDYPFDISMFALEGSDEEFLDDYWDRTLVYLEKLRVLYNETGEMAYFRAMKKALPEAFLQKRTVTMNYETILNQLHQRRFHPLTEWSKDYTDWALNLPFMYDFFDC